MTGVTLHRVASGTFGALVGVSAYWIGIDPLLSSAIGVAVTASTLFMLRISREFPDRTTGDGWVDGRWTGVSFVVVNFAAIVGLRATPLRGGYRPAVAMLVIFVGLSAYLGGSLAEMERDRFRKRRG